MLPEGWSQHRLGELISSVDAGVSVNGEDRPAKDRELGVLKVSCVSSGTFVPQQNKAILAQDLARARTSPKADRIVVSRSNTEALVGASAYIARDYPNLFLSDKLWQLEPRSGAPVFMRWLAYWLSSKPSRDALASLGTGTSGSMKNISKDELLGLWIHVPSVGEQQAIAEVIETWDQAITLAERLLSNSRRQRECLSDALLKGRRRLFLPTPWRPKQLADLVVESRVSGSTGDVANKLTVKLYGKGVIAKSERRQGSESTVYYRRRAGQFIYSKLDFLNGAFGLIPDHLDGYESTLDLPAFDFLDGVDPRWFLYYVSRPEFYQGHLGLANGGRKARRVNPPDLLRVSINVPPQEEQKAIADAIDAAWAEERKWEAMCELLKQEKRALMADLLTGKRRVPLRTQEAA